MQKDDQTPDVVGSIDLPPSPPGESAYTETYVPFSYIRPGHEFEELLTKTVDVARCLGSGPSEMGAWQNELPLGRFLEAAILDRVCLEMTCRGFVPKVSIDVRGAPGARECAYQGKGVWRVHEVMPDGDLTKYETGTQHFLDVIDFPGALQALRAYVGQVASRKVDRLREDLATVEQRLAAL